MNTTETTITRTAAVEACRSAGENSAEARIRDGETELGRTHTADEIDALADSLETDDQDWGWPDGVKGVLAYAEMRDLCRSAEIRKLRRVAVAARTSAAFDDGCDECGDCGEDVHVVYCPQCGPQGTVGGTGWGACQCGTRFVCCDCWDDANA